MLPELIDGSRLREQYEGLLFDAFGVLIQGYGGIPEAVSYIESLNEEQKPYWVVSNGSCYSAEATAQSYQRRGLPITPDRIITSGLLAAPWLKEHGYQGSRVRILGPESCHFMAQEAGCRVVEGDEYDVLIIGNQTGFPLLETVDEIITGLFAAYSRGSMPCLLLPNPDMIYPGAEGRFGVTCGMVANMIEVSLKVRFGEDAPVFTKLGKPYSPIFDEARSRAGNLKLAMVGDQLITDIKGANAAGIDSVLIGTGISPLNDEKQFEKIRPVWRMQSF